MAILRLLFVFMLVARHIMTAIADVPAWQNSSLPFTDRVRNLISLLSTSEKALLLVPPFYFHVYRPTPSLEKKRLFFLLLFIIIGNPLFSFAAYWSNASSPRHFVAKVQ